MKEPPPSFRAWHLLVLGLLLVISIPWYWKGEGVEPVLLGMPAWAFFSYALSALFACCTAWFILYRWPEDDE